MYCQNLYFEIKKMFLETRDYFEERKARALYKQKKNKIIDHKVRNYFRGLSYEMAYAA